MWLATLRVRPALSQTFFRSRFAYALELDSKPGSGRSLKQFLLEDRRGHCEYFATATVLLLRHAGIPARYATGFSVQEFSELEQQYVVRARHAHAWALAWIDGRWQALDTTPADWAQQEDASASPLRAVYDLLSWLYYRFAVWSATDSERSWAPGCPALARAAARSPTSAGGSIAAAAWRPRPRVQGASALPAISRIRTCRLCWTVSPRAVSRGHATAHCSAGCRSCRLADPQAGALLVALTRDYYRIRFDPRPAPAAVHAAVEAQARRLLVLLS